MSGTMEKTNLPESWELVPLGEFVVNEKGKKPKRESKEKVADFNIPYINIAAFEEGVIKSWTNGEGCRICHEDDFLMVWDGSRSGLVGKGMSGALGSTLVRINFPGIFNDYAFYFLRSKFAEINSRAKGVGIPHVDPNLLWNYGFPVPPQNEQKRIVAKIEELFSELDNGVESLTTAHNQLKAYRQSVLKAAFVGNVSGAPCGVSSSWPTRQLGELIAFLTSGSRGWADYYSDHGDVFIRAQNLKHDRLDLSDVAYVCLPEGKTEGVRTRVQLGDVLITITGANVTKTGLLERDLGTAYVSQHIALCRPTEKLMSEYLYWYLCSESGGRLQLNQAAYGAGKPGLNLDNIRSVSIPVPTLPEQTAVVSRINRALEAEARLSSDVSSALDRVDALRQSILKIAFSGQLVAQDPADEFASVLLERIRAQKTAAMPAKVRKIKKENTPGRDATIIPFPHAIASITTTDLHAGVIGLAYNQHEQDHRTNTFGHVKAEKIAHLVEYYLGIPLGREPVKDAAGPNDYLHLKKVEYRASKANWFSVQQRPGGDGYVYAKKRGFDALIVKTSQALGDKAAEVEALIRLLLPLNTQQTEIVATLYAAWNNLLIIGIASPADEEIVTEARENWHISKLNIERERFFLGLEWMRMKQLTPKGIGMFVDKKNAA